RPRGRQPTKRCGRVFCESGPKSRSFRSARTQVPWLSWPQVRGSRRVPLTTMSTLRLPQREHTSRRHQSGTGGAGPYQRAYTLWSCRHDNRIRPPLGAPPPCSQTIVLRQARGHFCRSRLSAISSVSECVWTINVGLLTYKQVFELSANGRNHADWL